MLIAKLEAYDFDYISLKVVASYLKKRYQRVRINSRYSSWYEIIFGVPQGSILGPLLFNIYLCDFFFFLENSNIVNYADDNTPYAMACDVESVVAKLEREYNILFQWLKFNYLKANPDKSHLLLNEKDPNLFAMVNNHKITNSETVKMLGITIDNELKFNEHVSKLCKKASQKLHALSRISHFMNLKKRRMIMNAFIQSQFGYSPLVWMFYSRDLNNRINSIHLRALQIVYSDYHSSFIELLKLDNSFTVHERNIQTLAIEIYKVVHNLSPEIMKEVFVLKKEKLYCSRQIFETRNVRTEHYGVDTLSFLGPKIWALVPNGMKEAKNLQEFKRRIRLWKPTKCPCRLCKTYVAGVGFVDVAH